MVENQYPIQVQNPLPLPQLDQPKVTYDGEALVRDYVNPILAPMQPPIIYPHFGHANFNIRHYIINLF